MTEQDLFCLRFLRDCVANGVPIVNRQVLLNSDKIDDTTKVRTVFNLLLLSNGPLVGLLGAHDFYITQAGLDALAELERDDELPSVIYLPDLSTKLDG